MEIYRDTELPRDTEKIYYGFKLQLSKTYKWRSRTPITELYFDNERFYQNKTHYRFCYKADLGTLRFESTLDRIFDNPEEAKEAWNLVLQNYLDKYQSEFENNYENIRKYKL